MKVHAPFFKSARLIIVWLVKITDLDTIELKISWKNKAMPTKFVTHGTCEEPMLDNGERRITFRTILDFIRGKKKNSPEDNYHHKGETFEQKSKKVADAIAKAVLELEVTTWESPIGYSQIDFNMNGADVKITWDTASMIRDIEIDGEVLNISKIYHRTIRNAVVTRSDLIRSEKLDSVAAKIL